MTSNEISFNLMVIELLILMQLTSRLCRVRRHSVQQRKTQQLQRTIYWGRRRVKEGIRASLRVLDYRDTLKGKETPSGAKMRPFKW